MFRVAWKEQLLWGAQGRARVFVMTVLTVRWGFSHRVGGVRIFDAGVKILMHEQQI